MQSVISKTSVGGFTVYTSNGGAHSPELMAQMSLQSLVDNDSNPLKVAEIKQSLTDLYAQTQRTIRLMLSVVANQEDIGLEYREAMKTAIIQILSRDFNTALDIERQIYKE